MPQYHDRRTGQLVDLGFDSEGTKHLIDRAAPASEIGSYEFHETKSNPTEVSIKLPGAETPRTFSSWSEMSRHPRVQKKMKDEGQGLFTRKVVAPIVAAGMDIVSKSTNKSARRSNKRTGDRLRKNQRAR